MLQTTPCYSNLLDCFLACRQDQCLFSATGLIYNSRRSIICLSKYNKISFLHDNLDYIGLYTVSLRSKIFPLNFVLSRMTFPVLFINSSRLSCLAEPGLGAPLSSYLEGALYKLIDR